MNLPTVPSPLSPQVPPSVMPAGSVVLRRGQTCDEVLHVRRGRVQVGLLGEEGMAHQLATIDGPFWLEASATLLHQPHAVDALAETALEIERVPAAVFAAELQALPPVSRELLLDLARAQRQQTEVAISRLSKDADARCAQWLLQQAEPRHEGEGLGVTLRERKRAIAAQLGMAPETFSRVLRHLRERQLIAGTGRQIWLPNPQALRELAGA